MKLAEFFQIQMVGQKSRHCDVLIRTCSRGCTNSRNYRRDGRLYRTVAGSSVCIMAKKANADIIAVDIGMLPAYERYY